MGIALRGYAVRKGVWQGSSRRPEGVHDFNFNGHIKIWEGCAADGSVLLGADIGGPSVRGGGRVTFTTSHLYPSCRS